MDRKLRALDGISFGDCEDLLGVVDLNHVEAASDSPLDGGQKGVFHMLDIIQCHFFWMWELLAVRNGTWRIAVVGPAVDLLGRDGSGTQPCYDCRISLAQ